MNLRRNSSTPHLPLFFFSRHFICIHKHFDPLLRDLNHPNRDAARLDTGLTSVSGDSITTIVELKLEKETQDSDSNVRIKS